MGLADTITELDVNSPETFAQWVQQVTGAPAPNFKNLAILKKQLKKFFEENPTYDYRALCRTVTWANSKKRRYPHVWYYLSQVRWAFAAGALSDLTDSTAIENELSEQIKAALERESDPRWRYRLLGAAGQAAKQSVYDSWREERWAK